MKNINYKNKSLLIIALGLLIIIGMTGCKKFVDVPAPVTSTNAENVYATDATAAAVLTGIYAKMSQRSNNLGAGGISLIGLYGGLSADEFTLYSGVFDPTQIGYFRNELSVTTGGYEFWTNGFQYVFICNSAIEGLSASTTLTPAVKQQLLGEAKFIRALNYFYLVNLYGDVPIILTPDFKKNSTVPRSTTTDVYQQIITDLQDSENLLGASYKNADALTDYPTGAEERVRPTRWAVDALLARVYLFTNQYGNAEAKASDVINHTSTYDTVPLNSVFLKNSKEAIWQLQPVTADWNTEEAKMFILHPTGPNAGKPVFLSDDLLSAFDSSDQRLALWVNTYSDTTGTYKYPFKYQSASVGAPVTEYLMVMRLAEQYLIRAEARVMQNNFAGAQADLNVIRKRAGLGNTLANDQNTLIDAILQERRLELFSEWGHRWLDLKRLDKVDSVMSTVSSQKNGSWQPSDQLYPIPFNDIKANSSLTQNSGY